MRDTWQGYFLCIIASMIPICASAQVGCAMAVGNEMRWLSTEENASGELREEIIGQEGLLTIHAAQRTTGDSAPDTSLDLLFGGFYVGDLGDLFHLPFATITAHDFAIVLDENPTFFPDLFDQLRLSRPDQMEAISTVYQNLRPGFEISYKFSSTLSHTIQVLEPEKISLAFAGGKEIEASRLEVTQHYHNGSFTTERYWFTSDMRLLVRYSNDFGAMIEQNLTHCVQH